MNISHQVFLYPQYQHLKIENAHDKCRDEDCMKKFCESLRELAMDITLTIAYNSITLNKKIMKLSTNE